MTSYEPDLALDGGPDGLDVFRRLAPWAHSALKPDGFLAVELYEESLDQAADIARQTGFAHVDAVCDLNGLPRVLVASKTEKEPS